MNGEIKMKQKNNIDYNSDERYDKLTDLEWEKLTD